MWSHLLFILFLSVALQVQADDDYDNWDTRSFSQVLKDNLRRKCQKKGDDYVKKLEAIMEEAEDCLKKLIYPSDRSQKTGIYLMVCNRCLTKVIDEYIECLEPQEKIVKDLFYSDRESVCENDGSILKEKLNVINATCPEHTLMWMPYGFFEGCVPKLKFMHHKLQPDFLIDVSDVCSDVKTSHKCLYKETPAYTCEKEISDLLTAILEPYLQWCETNLPKTNTV